jgi:cold shock protein
MTDAVAQAEMPGEVPVQQADDTIGGRLKWYDPAKGYGFITPTTGERDVFLHVKELRRSGIVALNDGAALQFRCQSGPKGPYATDLKVLPGNGTG